MNNCITASGIGRKCLELPNIELCELPVKLSKRLWIEPKQMVERVQALPLAEWALARSQPHRALPEIGRRGRKAIYRESSILVMALIQVAWQMSYEDIVDYLRSHTATAAAIGFEDGRVIGVSRYWERRRALGILPFWLFFIALAWQLIRLGVISGYDVILDATTQRVWFHDDDEAAWSFPKLGKGSIWGYKVHTLLCRHSQLPLLFLVTPANRQESLCAIPLLTLAIAFYGLSILIVRADAGYFTYPILNFIRTVLQAGFMIDYNLRRKGKRFLATLFFVNQWRFHLRPRSTIERHFAWAKRYFGLESAHWAGLVAAYQQTALVYSTMLVVALLAHLYQRPELATSPTRVLARKIIG
jgi:hypothetical protein